MSDIDNEEMKYIVKQAKRVTGGIVILILIVAILYFRYGN